ncbi:MAG: hypothetical protein IJV35_00755 [Neisseriaceae bacterium]|nr:hypothetical protein [Neisseriaceae bacterium]
MEKKELRVGILIRNGTKPCATNGVLLKKLLDYKRECWACQGFKRFRQPEI